MDRCSVCGSTALLRALGETTCRACGSVESVSTEAPIGTSRPHMPAASADLAGEVDAAIRRVFGER